jgi:hypothetical protein
MTKPHTLSLVVVESSSQRTPVVSAVQIVHGNETLSLAHKAWRDEHPTRTSTGILVGACNYSEDYGGWAKDLFILG